MSQTIKYVAKNILIYRLGSLGDTVIALPCFHKVRESFPDATITLLTNHPIAKKAAPIEAILGNSYFFDQVLDYPRGTRNPLLLLRLILQIRSLRIDTIINLAAPRSKLSTNRDRWFFKAAGIKRQIGFPHLEEDFGSHIDPSTKEHEWEAKRLSRRLHQLGNIDLTSEKSWDLRLTDFELQQANLLLAKLAVNEPILAISIGTKLQTNHWGIDNWLSLLNKLKVSLPSWKLILIGAEDEKEIAEMFLEAWDNQGLNLCGTTSPRVSAAILQQAKIFIGHDSGPMHLAACVGTPCIGIFSARNLPGQWYPRGNMNKIIYHKTDCAGCGLEVCIEQKKKCILSISVDEVSQAVLQTIDSTKHTTRF